MSTKSKATLQSDIATVFADNTSGAITPAIMRAQQVDVTDSAIINPLTTSGDLLVGGAAGAPARLGVGSNGQVLSVVSGAPAWAAASGSGSSERFDAAFDGQGNTLSAAAVLRPVIAGGTIIAAAAVADSAGTSTITVRKYTPSGGSLGTATDLGTLSLTASRHASSAPSWAVSAGDVLEIEVSATTGITKLFVRLST